MGSVETLPRASTPELLTVVEVARLLRLSRASVYRLISAGELPALRLGRDGVGALRVDRATLEQWLADGSVNKSGAGVPPVVGAGTVGVPVSSAVPAAPADNERS